MINKYIAPTRPAAPNVVIGVSASRVQSAARFVLLRPRGSALETPRYNVIYAPVHRCPSGERSSNVRLVFVFLVFHTVHGGAQASQETAGCKSHEVETPVDGVEHEVGDGKDDPRVLVDLVDVLDARHGGSDGARASSQRLEHARPSREAAATAVVRGGSQSGAPVAGARRKSARVVREAARHAERRRELELAVAARRRQRPMPVAQARDRRQPHVVQLDDLLVVRIRWIRGRWRWWRNLGLLALLRLLFGSRAPVGVVDGRILEERGEHKHEAHDQVDVNGLDVRDPRKGGPNSSADGGHRQHRRDAKSDPGGRRLMVDPKGHPRQHHDQNRWKICLEDEVSNVPLELKTER